MYLEQFILHRFKYKPIKKAPCGAVFLWVQTY